MTTCPDCGHLVTPEQKFCAECGTRLSGARLPPEEERRLVTMLFADLAGSTSLAESLDPDALYELTRRVHHQLEGVAQRYEGHVARHLGDGLLVLFGAPIAHENDAERAVLAALGMQAEIERLNAEEQGPLLGVRIGITTGEVVAGHITGIYDVIGDAANVAARLQGMAPTGTVLVGEDAMRLARRRIRFGERQALALKGKREPVGAYAALGLRDQSGETWDGDGYPSPLVGRARELAVIAACWARAQAGDRQILTLVGEPGIGKSRLAAEAVDRITMTGDVRLLRCRCLSYGQSVSLWLIADLLRAFCRISEDAGIETVRERVGAAVETILADRDTTDRAIARDVLGEMLGLPAGDSLVAAAGPQVRRSALVRTLSLVLRALAAPEPVLLVLEDLHWLDAASQEILEAILRDIGEHRILVLATQRPGWTAPWVEWAGSDQVNLQALDAEDASSLARAVLGDLPLSSDLEVHLRDRADGNPFFVEELLQYLQETEALETDEGGVRLRAGVAEKLPATLTEVLLARLDRLAGEVKAVAQVGSVIGRSFAVRLLSRVMEREEALLEEPLQSLQEAEITYPEVEGELQHVFRHALLRDAAYSMLVRRRQRRLHLAVGRAIAQLHSTDEYVELIAYHFARTEEDEEAAGWLERAGDRARDTYANDAALEHYRAALERLERSGGEGVKRAGVELKLAEVLNRASRHEEAHAVVEQAIGRCRAAGDRAEEARATTALAWVLLYRGDVAEGRRLMEPIVAELAEGAPSQASVELQIELAYFSQVQGRYGEMLESAVRVGEVARAIGDEKQRARAELARGTALTALGRLEEAREALEMAIPLLEATGDLPWLSTAIGTLGDNRRLVGDLAGALRLNERSLELMARIGYVANELFIHLSLAQILLTGGEWGRAREELTRAEEIGRTRGTDAFVAAYLPLIVGTLALREGDWEAAAEQLERAAGNAREALEESQAALGELEVLQGKPQEARDRLRELVVEEEANLPLLLPVLAWAHLELTGAERALQLAEQAERSIRDRQMLLYLPEALRIRGMALARLGRAEEARSVLSEGRNRAAAIPNPYVEARILVELGRLDEQEGRTALARQDLEEALSIFRRLGATKDVEHAERERQEVDDGRSFRKQSVDGPVYEP